MWGHGHRVPTGECRFFVSFVALCEKTKKHPGSHEGTKARRKKLSITGKVKIPDRLSILFCRPFGAGYILFLYQTSGFTPGFMLSALLACCRATV
ncbi:MAG: hypothetical protein HW390_3323 [Candidatus Brocadiaceae bacterium]|nr:hypothetical protein [Candidatus Brocadiaceae bacterium]